MIELSYRYKAKTIIKAKCQGYHFNDKNNPLHGGGYAVSDNGIYEWRSYPKGFSKNHQGIPHMLLINSISGVFISCHYISIAVYRVFGSDLLNDMNSFPSDPNYTKIIYNNYLIFRCY